MVKKRSEPRREILLPDQCELWGRAAGRCEFQGCNRILYRSVITQELVNVSQKAHIHSFSEEGPRGRGPFKDDATGLNRVGNLMLLCYDCHRKVDRLKDGGRYNAELLKSWKAEHERRIELVASISPDKRSHVVVYAANIGDGPVSVNASEANEALFPHRYPAQEKPIHLKMTWEGRDDAPSYWLTEDANLKRVFDRDISPLAREGSHFSIFGFAPMPLLIRLGTYFTDRLAADVYQRHREPEPTWRWAVKHPAVKFQLKEPRNTAGQPALVLSLSDRIDRSRVCEVLGSDVSIWEITVPRPHNDLIKTRAHLSSFRTIARAALARIAGRHGTRSKLSIFPAMPVAVAVELGRVRMPKASMPWYVYDHNPVVERFVKALEIGGEKNERTG